MNSKTWVGLFGGLTVATIGSVALLNLAVNPYGVFPYWVDWQGVNAVKVYATNNDRMAKFHAAQRCDPEIMLFGSSRIKELPLDTPQRLNGSQRAYNFGLGAATIKETWHHMEWFADHSDVQVIYLGLDFFSFSPDLVPPPGFSLSRLKGHFLNDWTSSLITLDALVASLKTVAANMAGRLTEGIDIHDGVFYSDFYKLDSAARLRKTQSVAPSIVARLSKRYSTDRFSGDARSIDQNLEYLARIVNHCRENEIRLYLYISPVHSSLLAAVYDSGAGATYEYWKTRIAELSPCVDYSGMSEMHRDLNWFRDPSHIRKHAARPLFERLHDGQGIDGFGVTFTRNNVLEHNRKLRIAVEQASTPE